MSLALSNYQKEADKRHQELLTAISMQDRPGELPSVRFVGLYHHSHCLSMPHTFHHIQNLRRRYANVLLKNFSRTLGRVSLCLLTARVAYR